MTTRKTTDLWVTTKNELGTLARLTTPLKANNINVESFVAWEEGGNANFRFVTNNNTKAREIWTNDGFKVKEDTVVMWTTNNKPGILSNGTTALAEAKINTYCTYATTIEGGNCTVTFYTDNPDRTTEVLNKIR